jgi:hypothetical protein
MRCSFKNSGFENQINNVIHFVLLSLSVQYCSFWQYGSWAAWAVGLGPASAYALGVVLPGADGGTPQAPVPLIGYALRLIAQPINITSFQVFFTRQSCVHISYSMYLQLEW